MATNSVIRRVTGRVGRGLIVAGILLIGTGIALFLILPNVHSPGYVHIGRYEPLSRPNLFRMFLEQKIIPLIYRHPKTAEVAVDLFSPRRLTALEAGRVLGRAALAEWEGCQAWVVTSDDRERISPLLNGVEEASGGELIARPRISTAEFISASMFVGAFMAIGPTNREVEAGVKFEVTPRFQGKRFSAPLQFLWTQVVTNQAGQVALQTNAAFSASVLIPPGKQLLVVSDPKPGKAGMCFWLRARAP